MVIRRLLRVALLSAATVACGDAAYAPTPTALVGEYSVQAGTGFGTDDIALALEAVADSSMAGGAWPGRLPVRPRMDSSLVRWPGVG